MELGLIELGLLLWGAWSAGVWWTNYTTKRNMKELLDDLGVPMDAQKELPQTMKNFAEGPKVIELTNTGDMLYAHDANTGNFMGQSKDREELFKYIAKEFGEGRYEVVDRTTN